MERVAKNCAKLTLRPLAGRAGSCVPRHADAAHVDRAGAQESAGNFAIQSLLRSGIIRAKLTVSQPNDPDEREADRVADAAVSGAPPTLMRRKCASCAAGFPCGQSDEETPVRLKGNGAQPTPSAAAAMPALSFLGSGDRPLPRETRRGFETKLGADLSGVRIHDGPAAAQAASALNARAFTVGSDIAFAPGQFRAGQRRPSPPGDERHALAIARRQPGDTNPVARPVAVPKAGAGRDRKRRCTS